MTKVNMTLGLAPLYGLRLKCRRFVLRKPAYHTMILTSQYPDVTFGADELVSLMAQTGVFWALRLTVREIDRGTLVQQRIL